MIFLLFFLFGLSTAAGDAIDDRQALLSFKSTVLHDPLHTLSNWNSSIPLCSWTGVTCSGGGGRRVTALALPGRNISGGLPSALFRLPNLLSLNLSDNNLSGPIPAGPYQARSMTRTLDLSNNILVGEIPKNIGTLTSLTYLDLGGNELTGRVPTSITNLTELECLTLASNQLSGEIPRGLERLQKLGWIYLGYNNLSGEIPAELGQLTRLEHLDLVYNKLSGQIPSSFGNLTNIQSLFLYGNRLAGPIPKPIFSIKSLKALDLSDNFLSGEVPESIGNLQELEVLHLFSNNLTGGIPTAVSSLPKLQVLQLWSNNFSGEIPGDLGKRNNLTVLDLSTNNLAGKIPEGLCRSGRLFKLILFSNSLEGSIPSSLGHCRSLKRVRLQNNKLSGELPAGFTTLPLVYFLDVSGNLLTGHVGGIKWAMPELQMLNLARNRFSGRLPDLSGSAGELENLDLSENGFSGEMPPSFGRLPELMVLKASRNSISGSIPAELDSCKKLVNLDLSHNRLTGPIPASLTHLPVLGQLDLSENQLSGDIPANLGAVDSLTLVNLSHNHLQGPLPSTGAFLAINFSAVAGNELCGGDQETGLPACNKEATRNQATTWRLMAVACSLALVAVMSLLICILSRKCRTNKPKPVSSLPLAFTRFERNEDGSIWELGFFDSRTSSPSSSSVNRLLPSLDLAARTTVVPGSSRSEPSFVVERVGRVEDETAIFGLGQVRHRNVVRVVGVCRGLKNGGLFLVYEGLHGDVRLSEVLHGMGWRQRRRAAAGVARALRYLHGEFLPPVVVGDLSPERVVVDGGGEAMLRLGVPATGLDAKWFVSSPYVAPETREAKSVTTEGDIYGFGVMLIELLTGRSPSDVEQGGAHRGIVAWAQHCYSDCHVDTWIDPLLKESTSGDQSQMVKVMSLALECTADEPDARPGSGEVVKALEGIMKTGSSVLGFELCSS